MTTPSRSRRGLVACLLVATLSASCTTAPPPPDPGGEALARAEQAFADHAVVAGTRAAFMDVLAERATLFRPEPVDGRSYVGSRPDPGVDLRWRPQLVAVSNAGDLGLATGPWRLAGKAVDDPPGYGQFLTVWTKDASGAWRVLVDHGIDHPGAVGWDAPLETLAPDPSHPIDPMTAAEARFDVTSSNVGVGQAYLDFASPSMRALREGEPPLPGAKKEGRIASSVFADATLWTWTVIDSGVAKSGDLGWVTGRYRVRDGRGAGDDAKGSTGYYVRVWRSEGRRWRVLGDVLSPTDEPAHGLQRIQENR